MNFLDLISGRSRRRELEYKIWDLQKTMRLLERENQRLKQQVEFLKVEPEYREWLTRDFHTVWAGSDKDVIHT